MVPTTYFPDCHRNYISKNIIEKGSTLKCLVVSKQAPLIENKMASRIVQGLSDDEMEDLKTQIGHSVGGYFF